MPSASPDSTSHRELATWFAHLIRIWRQQFHRPATEISLTPEEIQWLAKGVQTLSHGLTRERSLSGQDYFKNPALLAAYLLFYWPVSYLQARFILEAHPMHPAQVLELGSGAGPLGAACFDLFRSRITLADRNPAILSLAQKLLQTKNATSDTLLWNPLRNELPTTKTYDLISLQHALNELWPTAPDRIQKRLDLIKKLLPLLTPGGRLLLIEPALLGTSRDLLELRDHLLEMGLRLEAPCLCSQGCPALQKSNDTCHMELPWSPPHFLKTSIKLAGFQKKELKMTYFLFNTQPGTRQVDQEIIRIVSDKMLSKNGKLRFIGCNRTGRISLSLHPSELSATNNLFPSLKRGDLIQLKNVEQTENGLKLYKASFLQLMKSNKAL